MGSRCRWLTQAAAARFIGQWCSGHWLFDPLWLADTTGLLHQRVPAHYNRRTSDHCMAALARFDWLVGALVPRVGWWRCTQPGGHVWAEVDGGPYDLRGRQCIRCGAAQVLRGGVYVWECMEPLDDDGDMRQICTLPRGHTGGHWDGG
jgi:hypothetical protein